MGPCTRREDSRHASKDSVNRLPGRAEARRALEARQLPRGVAVFYLKALAASRRSRGADTLASPLELRRMLEVAAGCREVIDIGYGDLLAAIALALDDAGRRVTVFRPARRSSGADLLRLVEPRVRARIDVRERAFAHAPVFAHRPACLALVTPGDASAEEVSIAFESGRDAVAVGAKVVFVGHGDPRRAAVREAVEILGLDVAAAGVGLATWARPQEALPVPAPPPRPAARIRRRPPIAAAIALAGIAIGIGAGALVTSIGSDGGADPQTVTTQTAVSKPTRTTPVASAPAHGTRRGARRRDRRHRSRVSRGRVVRRLSGRGPRRVAVLRVPARSVLRWRSGNGISIASTALRLSTPAKRGQTAVARGVYRNLRVTAPGRWTIEITAR
jgi:hypothetical protein